MVSDYWTFITIILLILLAFCYLAAELRTHVALKRAHDAGERALDVLKRAFEERVHDALVRAQDAEKNALERAHDAEKNALERAHDAEKNVIGLQKDLVHQKMDYLRTAKSLNARSVFEMFENENLRNMPGRNRSMKWKNMVDSQSKPMNLVVQKICSEGLLKGDLPETAQSLYCKLCHHVHKSYEKGDEITIMKDYITEKERLLFYGICGVLCICKEDIVEYTGTLRQISGKTLKQVPENKMESKR